MLCSHRRFYFDVFISQTAGVVCTVRTVVAICVAMSKFDLLLIFKNHIRVFICAIRLALLRAISSISMCCRWVWFECITSIKTRGCGAGAQETWTPGAGAWNLSPGSTALIKTINVGDSSAFTAQHLPCLRNQLMWKSATSSSKPAICRCFPLGVGQTAVKHFFILKSDYNNIQYFMRSYLCALLVMT